MRTAHAPVCGTAARPSTHSTRRSASSSASIIARGSPSIEQESQPRMRTESPPPRVGPRRRWPTQRRLGAPPPVSAIPATPRAARAVAAWLGSISRDVKACRGGEIPPHSR